MFNWAVRKRVASGNPALADPPRVKSRQLEVPSMTDVRAVQDVSTPEYATFIQLAATVGARRGTLVALRWGDVNLGRATITFLRVRYAESEDGTIEKGTKSDRTYSVTLGPDTKEMLAAHARRSRTRAAVVEVEFGQDSFVFSDDTITEIIQHRRTLEQPCNTPQRPTLGRHGSATKPELTFLAPIVTISCAPPTIAREGDGPTRQRRITVGCPYQVIRCVLTRPVLVR